MSQPNPNETKIEQQRSDAARAALKDQVEDNYENDSESVAENIDDNSEASQSDK